MATTAEKAEAGLVVGPVAARAVGVVALAAAAVVAATEVCLAGALVEAMAVAMGAAAPEAGKAENMEMLWSATVLAVGQLANLSHPASSVAAVGAHE